MTSGVRKKLFIYTVIFLFCRNISFAQSLYAAADSIYNLAPFIEMLGDGSRSLKVEEVVTGQHAFKKNTASVPFYANANSYVWCRFKINNTTGKSLYLMLHTAAMDTVLLYQVKNGGIVSSQINGDKFPFKNRQVQSGKITFILPENINDSSTFYLRLHITHSRQFPITVGTYNIVDVRLQNHYFFTGIFYGLLLIMVLYNFFVWLQMRETSFLFYVIYLISIILTMAQLDGYNFQFLWPAHPVWNDYPGLFPSLSCVFAILMLIEFLNLGKDKKRFYKISVSIVILSIVGVIWSLSGARYSSLGYIRIIIFGGSLFYIYVGYYYWRRGFKPARFFLLGWSALTTFVIINLLREYSLIPYNLFTAQALKIGTGIQVLLLGLALGDRILFYKDKYAKTLERYQEIQLEKNEMAKTLAATVDEKVREKTGEMQEKDEFKNKIISIISHDLKSPVNSLQMILDLLDSKSISGDEANELMDKIKKQVTESSRMMDNILDWSRNQLQGFKLHKQLNSVNDLANHVIKGCEVQAQAKNIRVDFKSSVTEAKNIDADILKLILRNLLNNSLKFSYPNSTIEVSAESVDGYVIMRVKDYGTGIPHDKFALLFDMSKKYTTRGTSDETGSGLGLKLASEFAQKHGGNIMADSEPGKGSTFTFTLKTD